jgi:hypothetical protein
MSKNIYFGIPAKKIRRITPQDRFWKLEKK